jgi:diaminohydroxyphosphoribosylaminopyrimidine deaminase / 5-amino-6-(5-phosphoribosylamino)uracil reductase
MNDESYIRRCFQLARLGAGSVSPNPLVGAVMVYEGKIIGEGWHQKFGQAHAEVNCINEVLPENRPYIPYSTLFCNLEPCTHFGKTPPCTDLILANKIPRVVISNTDPNPLVAGQGIEKLRKAGIEVKAGVLEEEGRWLNRSFFTWITQKRPRIILKWAQTQDGFIGKKGLRTAISSPAALRLVHRWRSNCDSILVGTQTALLDNPRLDVRYFYGKKPVRITVDLQGKIPLTHHLLDDSTETWIYGVERSPAESNPRKPAFERTKFSSIDSKAWIPSVLEALTLENRASLLVEGGSNILEQFIKNQFWDEIRVIENKHRLGEGVMAPNIPSNALLKAEYRIGDDMVRIFAQPSYPT